MRLGKSAALILGLLCAHAAYADAPTVTAKTPADGAFVQSVPSVQVTFSVAVNGVAAGDLKVNDMPATAVAGNGAGPYTFTGYPAPDEGQVTFALAAGNIKNAGDNTPFAGATWNCTLDTTAPGVSSVTRTQVTSGLKEGDAVALPTEEALRAGQKVRPVFPEVPHA